MKIIYIARDLEELNALLKNEINCVVMSQDLFDKTELNDEQPFSITMFKNKKLIMENKD